MTLISCVITFRQCFLQKVLGVSWDKVHCNADKMATCIDDAIEDKMFEVSGKPLRCPHGTPIPSKVKEWQPWKLGIVV